MANAGRVAIVPKGEYSDTVDYKRLDLVRFDNDLYIAKKANTGVAPTDSETWMLALENVSQTQYDDLINGTTAVGNALKLNGKSDDDFVYNGGRISTIGFDSENELWVDIDGIKYSIPFGMLRDAIDADTVGGYHASELLRTLGINGSSGGGSAEGDTPNWQDAPDKKQTWYYYEGIDTEAYNLPTPYCTVVVNKLNSARASALAISWTTGEIWSNALWSTWQGWKKGAFANEVLPLTGGTLTKAITTPLEINNTTSGGTQVGISFLADSKHQGNIGFDNGELSAFITKLGAWKQVLHTGNSQKVVTSASAPSDTSALWVDTTNKKVKAYIDGAWTAMA